MKKPALRRIVFFLILGVGYIPSLYYAMASFSAWLSSDPLAGDSGMTGAVIAASGFFAVILSIPSTFALAVYFWRRRRSMTLPTK